MVRWRSVTDHHNVDPLLMRESLTKLITYTAPWSDLLNGFKPLQARQPDGMKFTPQRVRLDSLAPSVTLLPSSLL
jgi:hypothetical protein